MGFCYHHGCREILKYAETECFSERHYISIYDFIYPFALKPPTGAFWNRGLFPFMLQCCLQTAELYFMTGNLQKVWMFKVCMGLSEFLRSANLMVSAYSLVLEALPGEIPDGNRGIIWLQRVQTKICIQALIDLRGSWRHSACWQNTQRSFCACQICTDFLILHEDPTEKNIER